MSQYDNNESAVWYRAEGESKDAVKALIAGGLGAAAYVGHLKTLGIMGHSAIQVQKSPLGYPRAYDAISTLWADPDSDKADTFYIQVPVDYKGVHHTPAGAVPLSDAETGLISRKLNSGGWGGSIPLTANFMPRNGTEMPADFDPATSHFIDTKLYFTDEYFENNRVFRAEGDLLWDLRAAIGRNAAHGKRSGMIALTDADWPQELKDSNGNTPALWSMLEGIYLVYKDHANAAGKYVAKHMKEVDPAEYVWVRQNKDDREIGIRPPEPPKALEHLYMSDIFLAAGTSRSIIIRDNAAQEAMVKKRYAFENKYFGTPNPYAAFNNGALAAPFLPQKPKAAYLSDGSFRGYKFNARPVPEGWVEIADGAGVYRPDPAILSDAAKECEGFNEPALTRNPAICGPTPAIVIMDKRTMFPRAELQWPGVHIDRGHTSDQYFIRGVTDYKGEIFRPKGSERVPAFQWLDFARYLPPDLPDIWIEPQPASVPADYTPEVKRYFVLGGASLAAYRKSLDEKVQVDNALVSYIKSLGDTEEKGHSIFGRELISLRFKTPPVAPGWKHVDGNIYRPDPLTPEGRAVFDGFANLPQTPDRNTLHAMLYNVPANGKASPYVMSFPDRNDLTVAIYPRHAPLTPPPGAVEMNEDMFEWLNQDRMDIANGKARRPVPPEIADFLKNLNKPAALAPRLPGPA